MKELLQIKSVLPFGEIPERIGRQRILRKLEEKVTTAIMNDIQKIVTEGLAEIESASFIKILQQLRREIQSLPISMAKSNLSQPLRFLVLVIKNRFEQSEQVQETLKQITQDFGNVPELNSEIMLPAPQFLPRNFENTIKKWGRIIWKNPSRESREERLEFFSQRGVGHRTASVRLHLIALDEDAQEKKEALSYAEADFYHIGNLQADHLQPSEDIVKRQMELVAAMNIDPIFRVKMLHAAERKEYFKEVTGIIYGTKKFYMEYHNCVENLWLISTAAGTKKGNICPIEWLRWHGRFGEPFFEAIGGEQSLRKDKILITTEQGKLLAESARRWFRRQYREEITTAGYICHQIKEPLLRQVEQTEKQPSKRRRIKLMAKITTAAHLAEGGSSSEGNGHLDHYSSPNSNDAEVTERNLAQMSQIAEKRRAVVKANVDDTARDYIEETKRRRKAERLEKAMDENDGDDMALRGRLIRGGK